MAKELTWPTKPLLSLIQQFSFEGGNDRTKRLHSVEEGKPNVTETDPIAAPAVWHGRNTATFEDTHVENILSFTIRFKVKDAYAHFGYYLILIDRLEKNESWERWIQDEVTLITPTGDHDNWYYCEREYSLAQSIWRHFRKIRLDTALRFKITGYNAIGSMRKWGDPHSKEFTAILKAPNLTIMKNHAQMTLARLSRYNEIFQRSR